MPKSPAFPGIYPTPTVPSTIDIIKQWVPPGFECEPIERRLLRALLNANACVEDQRRALSGKAPIRPLDSYPQQS